MELVYMILGQSAGAAACIAIDDDYAVQKVPYEKLKSHLLKEGQVLSNDALSSPLPTQSDNGRGGLPIKFNGSLFTVEGRDPDFRH